MKELSIEEKARHYDKAIEKAKSKIRNDKDHVLYEDDVIEIFPELAESEDERIRKSLLAYIKGDSKKLDTTKWIAWLEKQGEKEKFIKKELGHIQGYREEAIRRLHELEKQSERKPNTDSLLTWSEDDERMFKCIEGIVKDYWAKAEKENNKIKIREACDVSFFLKTIQKSPLCWIKCSDELPNIDGTYLVVTDGRHNDVYDMARYDSIEGWHKASEIIYWMPIPQLNNKSIIEQKSVEWSEEDRDLIEEIISHYRHLIAIGSLDSEHYKSYIIPKLKSILSQNH